MTLSEKLHLLQSHGLTYDWRTQTYGHAGLICTVQFVETATSEKLLLFLTGQLSHFASVNALSESVKDMVRRSRACLVEA